MTKSPLIITLAIVTLFGIIITVLYLIIPEPKLSKGIIVNKHTEPEHKINHLQIVGDVPIFYDETIPAKYYLDIRGYDVNNKIKTITIDVSEKTYDQYAVGDTLDSSTDKE